MENRGERGGIAGYDEKLPKMEPME